MTENSSNRSHRRDLLGIILMIILFLGLSSCVPESETPSSFINIGEFGVNRVDDHMIKIRDGAGRNLVLIPRGDPKPEGYEPYQVIEIPVRSVVAYGWFDVSILKVLGVIEETLVGVVHPEEEWIVPEVKAGMKSGKIAYLGESSAIDFEKLRAQNPELVLTWDHSIIPMLNEFNIPSAITTTPVAMCLDARMKFVQFLAPFFQKEKEAEQFFARVKGALDKIRQKTSAAKEKPKVMWGDIYEKRVLVEPGNAWVGELIGLSQSEYAFEDVWGTSCIEISIERFLKSGEDSDVLFTYRTPKYGATSKDALSEMNPLLGRIKPLTAGKVYSPLPHYVQSGDKLDEILEEISAVLHPDLYPDYKPKYFMELPQSDNSES